MFARVLALLPFVALLVSADGQCNTGSATCCNTFGPANSAQILNSDFWRHDELVSLLANIDAIVGLDCTGIVGAGSDCSQEPLCCEDNEVESLIAVNCSPINVVA